jgi:hypothetical protein
MSDPPTVSQSSFRSVQLASRERHRHSFAHITNITRASRIASRFFIFSNIGHENIAPNWIAQNTVGAECELSHLYNGWRASREQHNDFRDCIKSDGTQRDNYIIGKSIDEFMTDEHSVWLCPMDCSRE